MFAQSVFLMFSSVYVCKEMLEHLLLSVGEGHHHHRGDEDVDILGYIVLRWLEMTGINDLCPGSISRAARLSSLCYPQSARLCYSRATLSWHLVRFLLLKPGLI